MELRERIQPTIRPDERPIGFQCWSNLLFVHWRVPVATIRELIPAELTVDTFDGDAWIGLVPFYMSRVRPAGLPAMPWISQFCETNLRTYVHLGGSRPGVWFFSLEAARLIAVGIARWKWRLNYHWAKMSLRRDGDLITYQSQRIRNKPPAHSNVAAEIGGELEPFTTDTERQSLEFFLAERYLLYTVGPGDRLLCGQVHHRPYPLKQARLQTFEQTITDAASLQIEHPPNHVLFSEGVNVEIFPLREVKNGQKADSLITLQGNCVDSRGGK